MATKIEWTAYDYAAQEKLAEVFARTGLSYRAIEARTDVGMSFARVRDIVKGNRAPVRLSEFIAICEACHVDPVATLRRIIAEAQRVQAERDAAARARATMARVVPPPVPDVDALADAIAADPDAYDLAANDDPFKEAEASTPRD